MTKDFKEFLRLRQTLVDQLRLTDSHNELLRLESQINKLDDDYFNITKEDSKPLE